MTLTFLTHLNVDECIVRLTAAGIGEADPSDPQPRIMLRGLIGSQDLGVTRLVGNEFRLEFRGGIPRFTRTRPLLAFSFLPYILEGRFLPDGGGTRIQIASRPHVSVAVLGVCTLALEGWAWVYTVFVKPDVMLTFVPSFLLLPILWGVLNALEMKRLEARSLMESFQAVFDAVMVNSGA